MELRHIRYFVAVAEEGNFTRAAARVGISQPPLSLQIKDLEAELGVQLFHRVPHGAELTEAGQAFLERVKSIPGCAADAVEAARRAARGEVGRLALGFPASAALNPIVPATVRAFRRGFPEVELRLEEADSKALLASVIDGRLDAAILRPALFERGDLHLQPLVDERLLVALPSAHAAAHEPGEVDLRALREDPVILSPRDIGPSLHNAVLNACREAGFEPKLGQPAPQIVSILSLVSAEMGFSLVPECMRQLQVSGVVYRPIAPPVPHVRLAIAYKSSQPSRVIRSFTTVALAIAKDFA
jgi:DNA-binding transcriptional LysR family regulator